MSARSTTPLSELTLFAEDSPAKTRRAQDVARALLEAARVSGASSLVSLPCFVRAGSLWKIQLAERRGGSTRSSVTWKSEAMRAYRFRCWQAISALPTVERAFSSLLPTPLASDAGRGGLSYTSHGSARSPKLRLALSLLPTLTTTRASYMQRRGKKYPMLSGIAGGPLNPKWLEWFMGFPDGWTESASLATPSRRSKRKSLGT